MNTTFLYRGWLGLLVVLMAVGAGAWVYQLSEGLAVTNMNNTVSWGLYITAFMYFVGLSAGGLIVVAGAQLAGLKQFRQLSLIAVLLSAASIVVAAGFILPDLGRPERAFRVIISGQYYSPLVWDVFVITTYLTIAAVDVWLLTRKRESERALTIMAVVSLPVAVLVHSITAWVFGLLVARPFWNTPLLAPLFISSALVSGLALLLFATSVLNWFGVVKVEKQVVNSLGKLLGVFLAIDVFFLFAEVLTAMASNIPDHRDQTELLLTGKLAIFFWPEVLFGALLPFLLVVLRRTREDSRILGAAALLALVGVMLKRLNIMMASMSLPLIQYGPGQPQGRPVQPGEALFVRLGDYAPSLVEWAVSIGIVAFGAMLVTLGIRYLGGRSHEPAAAVTTPALPLGIAEPGG